MDYGSWRQHNAVLCYFSHRHDGLRQDNALRSVLMIPMNLYEQRDVALYSLMSLQPLGRFQASLQSNQ